jgi:hypothetical protein
MTTSPLISDLAGMVETIPVNEKTATNLKEWTCRHHAELLDNFWKFRLNNPKIPLCFNQFCADSFNNCRGAYNEKLN